MLHITIKKLREEKQMTQQEFSKLLGVSPSTVGMYEQGRRAPDKEILLKIAKIFNVTTDYLLGNSEYPYAQGLIEEVLNNLKAKGYDVDDLTVEEIADLLEKGLKLDEMFKSK